jgi:hypothetical protein
MAKEFGCLFETDRLHCCLLQNLDISELERLGQTRHHLLVEILTEKQLHPPECMAFSIDPHPIQSSRLYADQSRNRDLFRD